MGALIAITTTIVPEAGAHRRPEVSLYAAYMSPFEALGMTCVPITPAHSAESIARLVGLCSGLVLTGGDDVDPSRYGETPKPYLGAVNPARDESEFQALTAAMKMRLPVLAICRGMQLLNVHLGGTLYQDLEAEFEDPLTHRQTQPWGQRSHSARVEPGSRLHREIRSETLRINSFHHQGVKDLAPELRATAWADDGLVEAVELKGDQWVVGVQWHPERHEAAAPETDPDRRLLIGFGKLVLRHGEEMAA